MAIPLITNLKLWVGTLFTKDDWDFNFKQIVSWLADGNADLVVNSVKATNGLDLDGATIKNVGAAQTGSEAVNLDQATTLLNRSSYYYPYTVASGKVDSSGNPAYIQKDSNTQVTVLAGNTNPDLVCISLDGTIESVTSNTVLTVPSANGTYNIIKEKEQPITITAGAVTSAKRYPTTPSIGDYYLNHSMSPFQGYKYTSGGWEEVSFCLLGYVTVSSGTATVTMYRYDYSRSNVIIDTFNPLGDHGYIIYKNGLCEQWGKVNVSSSTGSISFLVSYPNTNYNFIPNNIDDHGVFSVTSKSAGGVNWKQQSLVDGSSSSGSHTYEWRVRGFLGQIS